MVAVRCCIVKCEKLVPIGRAGSMSSRKIWFSCLLGLFLMGVEVGQPTAIVPAS